MIIATGCHQKAVRPSSDQRLGFSLWGCAWNCAECSSTWAPPPLGATLQVSWQRIIRGLQVRGDDLNAPYCHLWERPGRGLLPSGVWPNHRVIILLERACLHNRIGRNWCKFSRPECATSQRAISRTDRSLANGPIVAGGWGGILFTGRQTCSLYLVL